MACFPHWQAHRGWRPRQDKVRGPTQTSEARVQPVLGRVGARRTRVLCVRGHRDGNHGLPLAPARRWMPSEMHEAGQILGQAALVLGN